MTDHELVANRKHCPDGRSRCLDCVTPTDRLCLGRNMGCGGDDSYRIRIVELEAALGELVRLKNIKDRIEGDECSLLDADINDYHQNKDNAWAAARKVDRRNHYEMKPDMTMRELPNRRSK